MIIHIITSEERGNHGRNYVCRDTASAMKETGVETTTSKKLFVERPDDRLFSVHKIFAMGVKEETMPRCYFPFTFLFIIAPAVAIRSIARFVLAPPILSRTTFRLYELALKPMINKKFFN